MITTLFIDVAIEPQDYMKGQSIWRRLHHWFSTPRIPYGRRSVENQLRARPAFPVSSWDIYSHPVEQIRNVLGVIRDELKWPNDHFLPEDLLVLAFTSYVPLDIPEASVRSGFREKLGIVVNYLDFNGDVSKSTVGDFVSYALSRRK